MGGPWVARGMPMGCLWDAPGMTMGGQRNWLLLACPWAAHELPVGCLWDARGTVRNRRFIKQSDHVGLDIS